MQKGMPERLYKYRVWEEPCKEIQFSRRIITDNELYLASADQFNDPFDCALPFRYRQEDLTRENIFIKLYQLGKQFEPQLSDSELHDQCFKRQFSGAFEDGEYWKSFYPGFKQKLNDSFGILSLSAKKDDLLMWSHYSDCHRGFCVGLNTEMIYEFCGGQIGPVIYDNAFPEVPLFQENLEGMIRITNTKSKHWEYEDEYRIVKIYSARKVVNVPSESICEIILGCKMEDRFKEEIHQLVKVRFPHAKVFEAQINNEEFKIDLIPIIKALQ